VFYIGYEIVVGKKITLLWDFFPTRWVKTSLGNPEDGGSFFETLVFVR
jgi:hypothetical protein